MDFRTISTNDIYELFQTSAGIPAGVMQEYAPVPIGFHTPAIGRFSGNVSFFNGISVEWVVMEIEDNLLITDYTPADTIDINFQMKGHLYSVFDDLDASLNMLPGKHNLIFTPYSKSSHKVKKGDELHNFHISIENDYFLRMLGNADEITEEWVTSIQCLKAFAGAPEEQMITPGMQRAITEIMQCSWTGVMRKLYIESKVIEILVMQIEQFKLRRNERGPSTLSDDTDKLKQLKELLDHNFLDEYTLYSLVKTTNLNEFKLKTGFKQLFNVSVFGYLKQLRMQHAYSLLTDGNKKVEEVAEILGYTHAHHFSAAFKKHFGKTPSSVKA